MDAPPVLTPERIDAMLSIMAEVCLEGVVEGGQRQKAAEDFGAFERCGRTLQRACRNLRQTIALKQRFDREQARKAEDARRLAQDAHKEARRARDAAITARREQVRRYFDRVLWDEYEPDDAEDLLDDVHSRLGDMALDDDFLEAPIETLIQRLADEIGLNDADAEDEPPPTRASHEPSAPCGERVGSGGASAEPEASHPHPRSLAASGRGDADPASPASSAQASAISAVESDGSDAGAAQLTCAPAEPPRRPPDPPPEPYIAPWERLGPGQRMPGGSGW
jgi:hypothetical protein